jgi:hypothetical protein
MVHPVRENKVVLMSTLEPFPWDQIAGEVTEIDIHVEANIGAQENPNFLIVSAGDGLFNVFSKDNEIIFCFGGATMSLGSFEFKPPPSPIGVFTLSAKAKLFSDSLQLRAEAQVGDRQLQLNPNVQEGGMWGKDVRPLFQKANPRMFQGTNINALQTTIKWRTKNNDQ